MTDHDHDHDAAVEMFGSCPRCDAAELRPPREPDPVPTRPATGKPVARRTHPWTSWAAARSLPDDLTHRQLAVLAVFDGRDDLTLEQLEEAYAEAHLAQPDAYPRQAVSGIRTRASELLACGLVVDTGRTREVASGRPARVLARARPPRQERLI